jgi:hypothetical protein
VGEILRTLKMAINSGSTPCVGALIRSITASATSQGHAAVIVALQKIDPTVTSNFFIELLDQAQWLADFENLGQELLAASVYSKAEIEGFLKRRPRFDNISEERKFHDPTATKRPATERGLVKALPMQTDWPKFVPAGFLSIPTCP